MTKKTKRNLCLMLLITALGFSAVAFAGAGIIHRPLTTPAKLDTVQNLSTVNRGNRKAYVRRGLLSPRLSLHLAALGNRLERPGKERLTITGMLRLTAESQGRELVAVGEFPDRLRLVIQRGPQGRLITFDGEQATAATPLAADDQDLIETLAYDTAEHFFAAQMEGRAMRFLGARFRTDDGSDPNYDGPYFDIYKIADQIKTSGHERPAKLYYFNSDTLLLERVTYTLNRDGAEIKVETSLGDWQELDGQQVARRLERFENGRSVFVLTVQSAQLGQRADDGIFLQ